MVDKNWSGRVTEIIKAHVKETVIILAVLFLCATIVFCVWYYSEADRYKIVQIQNRAYKIDKKTGETWITRRYGQAWRKTTVEKLPSEYTLEELKQEQARRAAKQE